MLTPEIFIEQKTYYDNDVSIFGYELIGDIELTEFTGKKSDEYFMFKDINISFGYDNYGTLWSNIETITEFKILSCLEIWVVDHPIVKIPMSAIPELTRDSYASKVQALIRMDKKERKEFMTNSWPRNLPFKVFRLPIGLNLNQYENYDVKVNLKTKVHFKNKIMFYCLLW